MSETICLCLLSSSDCPLTALCLSRSVATVMSEANPLDKDFNARMDHLNHYLRECDAPMHLRRRAREYLKDSRNLTALRLFEDVYTCFSPQLRDGRKITSCVLSSTPLQQILTMWLRNRCGRRNESPC